MPLNLGINMKNRNINDWIFCIFKPSYTFYEFYQIMNNAKILPIYHEIIIFTYFMTYWQFYIPIYWNLFIKSISLTASALLKFLQKLLLVHIL